MALLISGTLGHTTPLLLLTSSISERLQTALLPLERVGPSLQRYEPLSFSTWLTSASSITRLLRRVCVQGFHFFTLGIRIWPLSHRLLCVFSVTWFSVLPSPFLNLAGDFSHCSPCLTQLPPLCIFWKMILRTQLALDGYTCLAT